MTDTTCSTKRKFHSEAAALSFEQEFRRNNPSAEQQRPLSARSALVALGT